MTYKSLACSAVFFAVAACSPDVVEPEAVDSSPAEQNEQAHAHLPEGTRQCGDEISQALIDVCVLSADVMAGRLVESPGNALARDYIIARYEQIGLQPLGAGFEQPFDFTRRVDRRDPDSAQIEMAGVNLIGMIEGRDPSKYMAVTAHFDHVGVNEAGEIFNGADDNASGVGAILAVAEHFAANPPEYSVLIIALDAEEGGLDGARHFVANLPEGVGQLVINLNFDMVGYSPEGDIWIAGSYHTPGLLPLIEATAADASVELQPGYDRPTEDRRNDWTLLSDHAPFHTAGYAFLYLGVEDHEHYHQPSDDYAIIDPTFYNGVVAMSVDLAERLDSQLAEISQMERRTDPDTP